MSFVACVGATWLVDSPLVACRDTGCFGGDLREALGAIIQWRNLPSIVVTLGMSFVWQGLALLVLPKPGAVAPDYWLGRPDGQATAASFSCCGVRW